MMTRPRDDDGWPVPKPGTKARIIYGLRKYGLTARQISNETGYNVNTVRVMIAENRWSLSVKEDTTWFVVHRDW